MPLRGHVIGVKIAYSSYIFLKQNSNNMSDFIRKKIFDYMQKNADVKSIPVQFPTEKLVSISFKVSEKEYELIQLFVTNKRISISDLVREAIKE